MSDDTYALLASTGANRSLTAYLPNRNANDRNSEGIPGAGISPIGPVGDLQLVGSRPRLCQPMYPYATLRGPTYRENSHANHTWRPSSRHTACFQAPNAPSVRVRFPSPAPLFVVWRVPALSRMRLSSSASSHSLDAATAVPLIECVDRPLGKVVLDGLIRPSLTSC
jgi:hypothetical protein